jgi:MtrB/PioB family decaheme-associated outer membrane protein
MIKKVSTVLLSLSLAVPSLALAEDDAVEYHGAIELGLLGTDVSSHNSAKFNEYRDTDNGLFGSARFDVLKDANFLKMDVVNPGRDDQSIDVQGGKYGLFKYNLYFDEMPHNYSYNALSPFQGLGSNHLTLPADPSLTRSTADWSPFGYSVEHKKYGGQVEVALHGPYFLNFGVERRQQDGVRPYSITGASITSEVPLPISYTTDNLNVKTGYLGKNITASVSGYLSSFSNDYEYLKWDNLKTGTSASTVTVPDNNMGKLAGDFSWRGLPLKSTLAVNASYTNMSDSFSANEVNVNQSTMGTNFSNLNRTTFDGKIDYTTFSVALASQPLPKLDSRIYYRYLDRENDSSQISYGTTTNALELLSYDRNTAGIELGYRLPQRTKLTLGYDYESIDRSTPLPVPATGSAATYRYENPSTTTDNTFSAKVKNSSFDWLTTTLKYKHLERHSDYNSGHDPYVNQSDLIRLDAADKSTDEVKLGFDFLPFDRLDFGVDFTYQKNNYDYDPGARSSDERENVYFDITWRPWKKVSLNTFVGFEYTQTDANRITASGQKSPAYVQVLDENFWTYGIALNLPEVINRVSFKISWQYQKSDGSVKFDNSLTNTNYVNINNSDDYTKQTLDAKAIYAFDDKWSMTVGYLYERFDCGDIAFANYQYIFSTTDLYSGLYYGQNYNAHVGYVVLAYKF